MTTGSNALLLLVTMGIDSPAVAVAPTPVNIDFTAPAGCSSLDSFYRGVLSRTDRVRLANPGEQGVQIRVRVTRAGSNIRGELRIGDQQEESETRRVDGISCNEVVEALSLTAAIALDPSASLLAERNSTPEHLELAPPATAAPALPGSVSTLSLPPPSAFDDAEHRIDKRSHPTGVPSIDLLAQASAATYMTRGLMRGPRAGVRVTVPVRGWTRLAVGIQGFYLSNDLLSPTDVSIFQLSGVSFSICPIYANLSEWLEFGACGVARGAWLRATGVGFNHPLTVSRSWWALGVESLVSVRVQEHFGFELAAGLDAPVLMREFSSGTPAQDAGKTSLVAAEAGVGVAYRF